MLTLFDYPDGMAGTLEYDADLFEGATIERLFARLRPCWPARWPTPACGSRPCRCCPRRSATSSGAMAHPRPDLRRGAVRPRA